MKSKLKLTAAMLIFGTIGIFVRHIPLSSALIALFRGVIGLVFLLGVTAVLRSPLSRADIRKNALLLIVSGALLGLNWVMLFESYRHTTVATATLCYYLAPIFVILVSPFLLGEKLTVKKILCMIAALIGMVFVSGVADGGFSANVTGIVYGLIAAVFYASVVLLNKKMHPIGAYDKTIVQLAVSSAVLGVYMLCTGAFSGAFRDMDGVLPWVLLLVVGIVHTGIAYALYFSSVDKNGVSSQTAAVLSYIDPVTAIILSALLLGEPMTVYSAVGTVLVLGAAFVSEVSLLAGKKK
ncbi:MAG: DMT family transporter [Clostridia bacterium]|nr:DMT family transporter [Clostridia bacterium]